VKERRRRWPDRTFALVCASATVLPLLLLVALIVDVGMDGAPRLSTDFLTSYPSRRAAMAGVLPAMVGTLYLITLTGLIAVPLGIGAAIHLEEYARRGRLSDIVEINIANLAGVPSIIYGLLGLGVFVRTLAMGRSLLAGACTMALLILPMLVIVTRETLRTVPNSLREASYALGATRWQTMVGVVLPMAVPGIMTGTILSIARAIGETAPLLVVGALAYVTFLPDSLNSSFTVLPIQIFNWMSRPQHAFAVNAAAAILVLLAVMLVLNAIAIVLRHRSAHRSSKGFG